MASSAVSTQKGISGMIMKANTKRRRGKQEIKDAKLAEQQKERDTQRKLARIADMEARIAEQDFQLKEATKMHG